MIKLKNKLKQRNPPNKLFQKNKNEGNGISMGLM